MIPMSARLMSSRLVLPLLRSSRLQVHAGRTFCYEAGDERPFGWYVPIKKPPPEPKNANINRITDSVPLDPFTEDIDPDFLASVAPEFPISFNLAAFVNRHLSLQELVKLGVDLSVVEKNVDVATFLLRLDFERDIKPYIQLLHEIGIPADQLGQFITENPLIFKVSKHNIRARIEYLQSKKFPGRSIVRILTGYPLFLNYTIQEVDSRLAFVQQEFDLSPNQLRTVLINHPAVMALPTETIRYVKFTIEDLMGFEKAWTKKLILQLPAILSEPHQKLINLFDMMHNTGNIKHGLMIKFPEAFMADERTVRDRIDYLKLLGKDQFDPRMPLYIPLTAISIVSDEVFATKYARTSEADYDFFLKNR